MSEKTTIVNQVIKEVKKGTSGKGEWGHWTLYKIKFAQNDKTFSWFACDADIIPTPGMTALIVKYTVETSERNDKQYINYTIKNLEMDASNSVINNNFTPNKSNAEFNDMKDISIYSSYAKDLIVAMLPYNKKMQESTHAQLCDAAILRGKRMFQIAKNNNTKPAQPKPEPVKQPEPEQHPEPEDKDLPF